MFNEITWRRPRFSWYAFVDLVLNLRVPPAITQVLMRHTSIDLTMRYYTKLKLRDLQTRGLDLLPRLEA